MVVFIWVTHTTGPIDLPGGPCDRAIVDLEKLVHYCLDPGHPRGRHKARVFAARLGFTVQSAAELRDVLMDAAVKHDAIPGVADAHGARYLVDFPARGPRGFGMIRSGWIVRTGEEVPRLTTCYVL